MARNIGRKSQVTAAAIALAFVLMTIAKPALAQTFTILHNFDNGPDGAEPNARLTMDRAGNLYGVTLYSSAFQLKRTGSGWRFNLLHIFGCCDDGFEPSSPLTIGPDGSLYGTTGQGGGHFNCDHGRSTCGTIYKLTPPARACATALCPWTETILYRFNGGGDGAYPGGPLVFDQAGNIYGTAEQGGNLVACGGGCGAVFKLTPSNGSWTESVLYQFTGVPDGMNPTSGVIFDNSGNLYGTSFLGGIEGGFWGVYGNGTVFELSPSGSGWTEKILCRFQGECEGANPRGGLSSMRQAICSARLFRRQPHSC